MGRIFVVLLVLLWLSGCASDGSSVQTQAEQMSAESREQVLRSTDSREQLITFYKQQLKERPSTQLRIKLIKAYLESGDTESAAFHLAEVDMDEQYAAEIVFLKAQVAYLSADYTLAYQYAQTALSLSSSYPEAENLMGLIQAERGKLSSARAHFLAARRDYYDDAIIKNNLAVLDLIEENYAAAVQKLQPLYVKSEGDRQVTSNLLIAYSKLGKYQAVREILKEQHYPEEQIQSIFLKLRGMSSTGSHGASEEISVDSEETSAALLQVKVERGPEYESH